MISRRAFLKRAVAAGIVAAVAPSLLAKSESLLPPTTAVNALPDVPSYQGQLTYERLQKAYQSLVFGYDEPDVLIFTSPRAYRLFKRLYEDPRYQNEFCLRTVADDKLGCDIVKMPKLLNWQWPTETKRA